MVKQETEKNQYAHHSRIEMLKYIPISAKRVLDVGCNTGGFGEALKKNRDIEVWGVEPKKDAAVIAKSYLDFLVEDIFNDDIDLPNNFFDVITFNDVLEHIEDPWHALEITRIKLATEGIIVVSLPNILHVSNLKHMLLDGDFKYEKAGIRDKTHLRFFTMKSAVRMFNEVGFKVIKTEGINENPWKPSLIKRLIYKVIPKKMKQIKFKQFVIVATDEKKNNNLAK